MLTILPGAFLVEYALMVLLIAFITIAGVTLLAPIIHHRFAAVLPSLEIMAHVKPQHSSAPIED